MDEIVNNTITDKPEISKEGTIIAYASLVGMALIPIYLGSYRSVGCINRQKESGERPETMSRKDAAMFPIIASGALISLYIFFKIFSKEHVNLLLAIYFFALGVAALTHLFSPYLSHFIPKSYHTDHHFIYTKTNGDESEVGFDVKFNSSDVVTFIVSFVIGVVYMYSKHWVINNLFGMAFAINGVEILHINNLMIGCTLLGGLFLYDIFWVFGTDVMVTVAKSFEAPIKLVFPQDIFENWFSGKHFAMLGLGDIVIPGIFIAMLLRFDNSLNKNNSSKPFYFYTSFAAYFFGLVATIFVMSYYKHAQPALLYLVPMCIGFTLLAASIKGDLGALYKYEDHPEQAEAEGVASGDKKED